MDVSPGARTHILTVSKLNRLARAILEGEIGQIWLSAEISNFVAASSGHWYFTLKDAQAQVKAAMFKGANRRLAMRPKSGDKVLVRASVGLYEPRGDYQLIVEHLEPEGQGLLKQQFEQLKVLLSGQGLFSQQHKQPMPERITRIGIVTSSSGAAMHDIITVLKRRNPALSVILYPSQVQGQGAATQICQAIETANRRNEVDVLIVGRGGGSLEDLWCFNEESVARAIYASRLPIVSAVGHEVDITIADFVADVRAATPSAAAELVSQDQTELLQGVTTLVSRLQRTTAHYLKEKHYQCQVNQHRLQQNHPQRQLQQQAQRLDGLNASLSSAFTHTLRDQRERLTSVQHRLSMLAPQHAIHQASTGLLRFQERLQEAWLKQSEKRHQRIANAAQVLDAVSPLATLSRGYNIAFKRDTLIKQASQLAPGDTLTSRFSDGEVVSEVKNVALNTNTQKP